MNQKGFAGIVAILIFAIFFGGLAFAFYKGYLVLNNNSSQTLPSSSQTPSAQPSASSQPTPSPSSDETTNWLSYSSPCGFSVNYPQGWKATKYFIQDADTSCAYLTAPDYSAGLDSRRGFYMQIYSSRIGSFTKSIQFNGSGPKDVQVNNLDDLVSAMWSNLKDRPDILKKVIDKTYGPFSGKQFPTCCYESLNDFAFIHGNNIYEVQWPINFETGVTTSQYGTNLDQILSTFKFTQ